MLKYIKLIIINYSIWILNIKKFIKPPQLPVLVVFIYMEDVYVTMKALHVFS